MKKFILTILLVLFMSAPSFAQQYLWRYQTHATDCTSLTDGRASDLCYEQDDQTLYKCVPSSGGCDTASEWKKVKSSNLVTVCASGCTYTTDGTADDVQIQQALDALPSTGGKVLLLGETYNISASITVDDYQELEGSGYSTYLKAIAGLNAPVITESGAGAGNTGLSISNMRVDGNRANQTVAYSVIDMDNVTYSTFKDLYVLGGLRTGTFGVDASSNGEGLLLRNSNNNRIENVDASFNDYDGIKLRNSDYNTMVNISCTDNGRSCVQIAFNSASPPPATSSDYNSLTGMTANFTTGTPDGASPTTSCVYIHGGSYNSVSAISCYGARMAIGVDQGANYNVFSGSSFSTRGVAHPIVECASSASTPAIGNIFTSSSFTAISGADKEYVAMDANCADNIFFGNKFNIGGGSGTWTVSFASGSTNNDYFGNIDDGNLSFSSSVAGANGISRLNFLSTANYPGTMVNDGETIWTAGIMSRNVGAASSTGGGALFLTHSDGTAMASGERLGTIQFGGDQGAGDILVGANISVFAEETWSTSSVPARIVIRLAPSGSSSTSEVMRLLSTGNVGIGTTNPGSMLEIKGSVLPILRPIRNTNATGTIGTSLSVAAISSGDATDGFGPNINFEIGDNTIALTKIANIAGVRDGADNSGKIIFETYNAGTQTTKASIDKVGNVGIGTTTATARLHVNQPVVGALALRVDDDDSDATPFVVNAAGNVGIGTVSPTNSLEILSGSIRLVGIGTTTAGTLSCYKANGTLGYCTGSITNSICGTCN